MMFFSGSSTHTSAISFLICLFASWRKSRIVFNVFPTWLPQTGRLTQSQIKRSVLFILFSISAILLSFSPHLQVSLQPHISISRSDYQHLLHQPTFWQPVPLSLQVHQTLWFLK